MPEPAPIAIDLRVRDAGQLFNSLDPSPFHERDLDPDAEAWILESARRLAPAPVRLVVHLREPDARDDRDLGAALRAFFEREEDAVRHRLQRFLRDARHSLGIGLLFLTACMLGARLLATGDTLARLLAEGLTIAGWVSLWRPMEMLLYDWWPLRRERALLGRLARAPIEVREPAPTAPAAPPDPSVGAV